MKESATMFIYDIEDNTDISIEIKMKDKIPISLKSKTVASSVKNNCILILLLKYEDKILNFNNENLEITITVIIDNMPVFFKFCTMQYINMSGKKFHAIYCKTPGVKKNRRTNYRVIVDEYGTANTGNGTYDALITDISETGFAFIIKNWNKQKFSHVSLSYYDSLLNVNMQVIGRVVRTEEKDGNNTLFGCRLQPNSQLGSYLNMRQRKMLRERAL